MSSSSSSSSNSPCAACKCLRRKCTQECVFAPYFPPDNPQKFTNVHKVFGASNVSKLLNELSTAQREDAVNSLAYEAEYRLRDPVYGCVGLISILQHKLKQVQLDLEAAKKELAAYLISQPPPPPPPPGGGFSGFGPSPPFQITMPPPYGNNMMGMMPMGVQNGSTHLLIPDSGQHHFLGYERFDDVTATGFNQPALALAGSYDSVVTYSNIQPQPQAAPAAAQPPAPTAKSEDGGLIL